MVVQMQWRKGAVPAGTVLVKWDPLETLPISIWRSCWLGIGWLAEVVWRELFWICLQFARFFDRRITESAILVSGLISWGARVLGVCVSRCLAASPPIAALTLLTILTSLLDYYQYRGSTVLSQLQGQTACLPYSTVIDDFTDYCSTPGSTTVLQYTWFSVNPYDIWHVCAVYAFHLPHFF